MLYENQETTTTNNLGYKCLYCSKTYKIKANYKKHSISCEFFYNKNTKTHDEWIDHIEKIPTMRELYSFIKELAFKCNHLENEVQQLRQTVNIRKKREIIEWLNIHRANPQKKSFTEWYKSLSVDFDLLKKVFDNDLTYGIKELLLKQLENKKDNSIAAFTQKQNMFYIFDASEENNQTIWRTMENEDIKKMIQFINKCFLKIFVKWQKENETMISQSEILKDQEINYMIKINGSKISMEKRILDIKKWLYNILEENIEFYDFV
jgi:Holliday junction resolvase